MVHEADVAYPVYKPSSHIECMLRSQRITASGETPQDMLKRVVGTVFSVEQKFGTPSPLVKQMQERFAQYTVDNFVMLGTPTLTNAGRNVDSALSSCVVIPVNLRDKLQAAEIITSYYRQNMGSGFDLTQYDDPVGLLNWINDLSARETATGLYDRYIGNMANLHASHPKIQEFVDAKREDGVIKHFNISVDLPPDFMDAVINGNQYVLTNGQYINARLLFHSIAENAWRTGDPGVLFLDRMNEDNPVPHVGRYVSTPPCGEMGLAEGETCQFGYLNLANFIHDKQVHWVKLAEVTKLTTRVLDNAIEYSIERYPTEASSQIASLKRKIGIGICGLAETLIACDVAYDSPEGRSLARDILSFINYSSKVESVNLAEERGSCGAMMDLIPNRYYDDFLAKKYAKSPTNAVSADQWIELSDRIRTTGKLRNILTTALPPTGRSSIMLGVTSALEPIFSIFDREGNIQPTLKNYLVARGDIPDVDSVIAEAQRNGSFQEIDSLPPSAKEVLRTAKEISVYGHVAMVAALAGRDGVVDEAASKTVNLPHDATVEDIEETYLMAYGMGVKNISVYRDQTKMGQPTAL